MRKRKLVVTDRVNYMTIPGLKSKLHRDDVKRLKDISIDHFLQTVSMIVCAELGITTSEMRKNSRKDEIVLARHFICYYGCIYGSLYLKQISIFLRPNRPFNHSTIVNGREAIKNFLDPKNVHEHAVKVKDHAQNIEQKILEVCTLSHSQV